MDEVDYPYKVSVCIITYNQAEYIEKAIDSAIAQEVDFPYEIIIGDDCSTDRTPEILRNYKERYPDLIKLHLHQEHYDGIPGRLNNITNIESAEGKYIAFCDGDDYWISKDKLQKQADFMDENPEYAFCFHNAWYDWEGHDKRFLLSNRFFPLRKNKRINLDEIFFKDLEIPSASTFFRKKHITPVPDWFWDIHLGDSALQFLAAQHGDAYYMEGLKSVQLKNDKSVTLNYFEEVGHYNLLEQDLNVYDDAWNYRSHVGWNSKAIKSFIKFGRSRKAGNLASSIPHLVEAIRSDKKILRILIEKRISLIYHSLKS